MVKSIKRISLLKNKIKRNIIENLLSNKMQSLPEGTKINKLKQKVIIKKEYISEHYFTFQLDTDLFTLLYATLIFKWIKTERVLII